MTHREFIKEAKKILLPIDAKADVFIQETTSLKNRRLIVFYGMSSDLGVKFMQEYSKDLSQSNAPLDLILDDFANKVNAFYENEIQNVKTT